MSRKQRLPLEAYEIEGSAWHVTTRVDQHLGPPFLDQEFGAIVLHTWVKGCRQAGAIPHLVCLMPDHLHMVIEVRSIGLIEIMRRTKSYSTMLWRKHAGGKVLWQQSFYDHGLREPRDFETAIDYILANPVESGLVACWDEYPLFAGDLIEDLVEDRPRMP